MSYFKSNLVRRFTPSHHHPLIKIHFPSPRYMSNAFEMRLSIFNLIPISCILPSRQEECHAAVWTGRRRIKKDLCFGLGPLTLEHCLNLIRKPHTFCHFMHKNCIKREGRKKIEANTP
jgi:hypothetical protein